MSQPSTQITQLYVALFNRAPDPEGLRFWAQKLEDGTPLDRIVEQMFATAPARESYPEGLSGQEIVAQFYRNALGREPDAEGLDYWTQQASTRDIGEVLNTMIYVTTHYDGQHPDGLASAALFGNKAALAEAYTAALDAAGLAGINAAALNVTQPILAAVTSGTDVNALIAEIVDKAVALTAVALEKPEIVAAIIPAGGKLSDLMDAMPAGSTFADLLDFTEKLASSADSAAAIEALIPEGGSSLADFLEKLPAGTTPESLVESAAQGPGGLENIGGGVTTPPPPEPPPPPPPTTFTVTETAGVLAFGGSAGGAITVTESGGVLTFTRGGVTASATVAIDDLANDTGIPTAPGVTMAEAVFAAVKAKLAAGAASVDADGASAAQLGALAAGVAKVAAGGIANLTLTGTQDAAQIESLLGKATAAAVVATGMDAARLTKVADGIAGVADGGISGLTLNDGQSETEIENLLSKATGAIVVATGMDPYSSDKLLKVAGAIDSVATDGISGALALDGWYFSSDTLSALLGKYAGDSATLSSGDLLGESAQSVVVAAVIAGKFADGGLSDVKLSAALFATITGDGIARMDAAIDGVMQVIGGEVGDSIDATGYTKRLEILGNGGNDTITGGGGNDVIGGGTGHDVIHGGGGNDTILASSDGGCTINGGAGDDTIYGYGGGNTLTGGTGDDTFVFRLGEYKATNAADLARAADIITDFGTGVDVIREASIMSAASRSSDATAGTAKIENGVATFHEDDDELVEKLTAVANAIGSGGWAKVAVFQHEGDSYLFVSDSNAGITADDALIKLVGIEATALVFGYANQSITGFA